MGSAVALSRAVQPGSVPLAPLQAHSMRHWRLCNRDARLNRQSAFMIRRLTLSAVLQWQLEYGRFGCMTSGALISTAYNLRRHSQIVDGPAELENY